MHPDLKQWLSNGDLLVTAIAKWIGTLSARLVARGSPDVQSVLPPRPKLVREDGIPCKQALELIEIPVAADRIDGQWQPKVLHCEVKNVSGSVDGLQPSDAQLVETGGHDEPKSWKAARKASDTHDLRETGLFVFCRACGGHTSGRCSTVLQATCLGERDAACAKRLRNGRHPVSNDFLGPVTKWRAEAGNDSGIIPQPVSTGEVTASRHWDPRLALGIPHFWEAEEAEQLGASLSVVQRGPLSAALIGVGSTIRRRFRFDAEQF